MQHEPIFTVEGLRELGMRVPTVRFAAAIERFEAEDARFPQGSPRPGGVLFVGDSDIRLWRERGGFAEHFADLPALNRGFGGARTWELLLYFHRVVMPHRPRIVVYLCGDNDIFALGPDGPDSAADGFGLFVDAMRLHAPSAGRIFYLPIHPAPGSRELDRLRAQANDRLAAFCDSQAGIQFVDYLHLVDADAFIEDRLHLTADFYRDLADLLRPKLEAALSGQPPA